MTCKSTFKLSLFKALFGQSEISFMTAKHMLHKSSHNKLILKSRKSTLPCLLREIYSISTLIFNQRGSSLGRILSQILTLIINNRFLKWWSILMTLSKFNISLKIISWIKSIQLLLEIQDTVNLQSLIIFNKNQKILKISL